ncbi:hypothetical protein CSQ90_13470 [Janthinobacterium sp. BJB303]|nr:hypothetical protein CSQ90_13470 [Janthinobacterium sp. BJB303]
MPSLLPALLMPVVGATAAPCRLLSLKKQYGGMRPEGLRELKLLHEENVRLKKMAAGLSQGMAILQDVVKKGEGALKREGAIVCAVRIS